MLKLATRRSVLVHQHPARWLWLRPAPLRPRFVSPLALPRSITLCSLASRESSLAATRRPFAPSLSLLLVRRWPTRLRSTIQHPPFTLPPKFRLSTEPILSDSPSLNKYMLWPYLVVGACIEKCWSDVSDTTLASDRITLALQWPASRVPAARLRGLRREKPRSMALRTC